MKRSEVINKILAILEADTYPQYTDVSLLDVANNVMTVIEGSGMSPPKITDHILLREERKWTTEE